MAPGPKKKSFHAPRNSKNIQNVKNNEKKVIEINEANKDIDKNDNLIMDSSTADNKKYSKRCVENNWDKYEEPVNDQYSDSMRGKDFEVLLSFSGGSGSQLKLQDEKDWEEDYMNMKEISLNLQDLIGTIKCIPFHEQIDLKDVFDESQIMNFVSCAEKGKMCYKSRSKSPNFEPKNSKSSDVDPVINIVEESNSFSEPEECDELKTFVVQDKTENIINSLTSNLSFKKIPEKKEIVVEDKKSEASSDLDFLLSLNIPSKLSVKEKDIETQKNPNVDDWLNSILDD